MALAKQFVAQLDAVGGKFPVETGTLYYEVSCDSASQTLGQEFSSVLKDHLVVGLTVKNGIPARANGPALSCKIRIAGGEFQARRSRRPIRQAVGCRPASSRSPSRPPKTARPRSRWPTAGPKACSRG